jgi:hypothetical protein
VGVSDRYQRILAAASAAETLAGAEEQVMTAAALRESHVHTVAVLAHDRVIPFDLSTPLEIFGRVHLPGGRHPYSVGVCAPTPEAGGRGFAIRAAESAVGPTRVSTALDSRAADIVLAADACMQLDARVELIRNFRSTDGFWWLDTLEATFIRQWANAGELNAMLNTPDRQDRFLFAGQCAAVGQVSHQETRVFPFTGYVSIGRDGSGDEDLVLCSRSFLLRSSRSQLNIPGSLRSRSGLSGSSVVIWN